MTRVLRLEIERCFDCPYCRWGGFDCYECDQNDEETISLRNDVNSSVSVKCPLPRKEPADDRE